MIPPRAAAQRSGKGGRELGIMTDVAVQSASSLGDAEIAALQSYLKGEAEKLGH